MNKTQAENPQYDWKPEEAAPSRTLELITDAITQILEVTLAVPTNRNGERVFHNTDQILAVVALKELISLRDDLMAYNHTQPWDEKKAAQAAAMMEE